MTRIVLEDLCFGFDVPLSEALSASCSRSRCPRALDVLLLDEPTNHLDRSARQLIVDAMRRFEGIGILVSHDRELLESVTGCTARLTYGAPDAGMGAAASSIL